MTEEEAAVDVGKTRSVKAGFAFSASQSRWTFPHVSIFNSPQFAMSKIDDCLFCPNIFVLFSTPFACVLNWH